MTFFRPSGTRALRLLLLLGASAALARAPRPLVFQDPALGTLRVKTVVRETDEGSINRLLTKVRIVDAQGRVAGGADLGPAGTATVALRRVAGLPSPLVVAIAPYGRADGVELEAAVLGVVGGRVRELFPKRIQTDADNALCLGALREGEPPAAALVEWDLDDTCILCWPKRFQVTRYRWSGEGFLKESRVATHRRHKSWKSALKEIGLRCPLEILNGT